jgi:hypothetical protein
MVCLEYSKGGILMKVKEMPRNLADDVMKLAHETYRKHINLSEYKNIDIYTTAYVIGYEEAWDRHSTLKDKMFITDETRNIVGNSARRFYIKNEDRISRDMKNDYDAFVLGFVNGYMMCWNSIQNTNS